MFDKTNNANYCYDFEFELLEMEKADFDLIFLDVSEIMNNANYFLFVF